MSRRNGGNGWFTGTAGAPSIDMGHQFRITPLRVEEEHAPAPRPRDAVLEATLSYDYDAKRYLLRCALGVLVMSRTWLHGGHEARLVPSVLELGERIGWEGAATDPLPPAARQVATYHATRTGDRWRFRLVWER